MLLAGYDAFEFSAVSSMCPGTCLKLVQGVAEDKTGNLHSKAETAQCLRARSSTPSRGDHGAAEDNIELVLCDGTCWYIDGAC